MLGTRLCSRRRAVMRWTVPTSYEDGPSRIRTNCTRIREPSQHRGLVRRRADSSLHFTSARIKQSSRLKERKHVPWRSALSLHSYSTVIRKSQHPDRARLNRRLLRPVSQETALHFRNTRALRPQSESPVFMSKVPYVPLGNLTH